jgi:tryptophanyl-tRNA synthetase
MSLNNPEVKMSKTDDSPESYVLIEDKPEVILRKFKRAVTDSENRIQFDPVNKPAISNLLNIYSGFTGKSIPELEKEFEGAGYGKLKTGLGEIVAEKFQNLQAEFTKFRSDMDGLNRIMKEGNERASEIANRKMSEVKQKLGLL